MLPNVYCWHRFQDISVLWSHERATYLTRFLLATPIQINFDIGSLLAVVHIIIYLCQAEHPPAVWSIPRYALALGHLEFFIHVTASSFTSLLIRMANLLPTHHRTILDITFPFAALVYDLRPDSLVLFNWINHQVASVMRVVITVSGFDWTLFYIFIIFLLTVVNGYMLCFKGDEGLTHSWYAFKCELS